jgi:6-phosphofructokinase 1
VEQLASGKYGVLMGEIKGEIVATPLEEVVGKPKSLDNSLIELAKILD